MDIKSLEERSKNMAAIHSKNTKPEVYLRKLLFKKGYRYGLNSKSVAGHPDIYLKNIIRQFLYMDVFGTGMRDVSMLICLSLGWSSGRKSLMIM